MSYFTEFLEKNGLRMEENVQLRLKVIRLIADEYDRVMKARKRAKIIDGNADTDE